MTMYLPRQDFHITNWRKNCMSQKSKPWNLLISLSITVLTLLAVIATQVGAGPEEPAAVTATLEDGALALNGDGHVLVDHHPELNPTDAITIEAWVWRDNASRCETVDA
jgi:hypothetical protein